MAKAKKTAAESTLNYEARLWQLADALCNNMDAAEYKHVVVGLIFFKYTSDALESKHALGGQLKIDYVLANPPFNFSDWNGQLLKDAKRWVYGVPPVGNTIDAGVQAR